MLGLTQGGIFGANTNFQIPTHINERQYAIPAPDCLLPVGKAYPVFVYRDGNYSAGIAYKGADYRTFILGFPFEGIENATHRTRVMSAALRHLTDK